MTQSQLVYFKEVYFKEVYGSEIHSCMVDPNWTISEFIRYVTPILSRQFGIIENQLDIIVPDSHQEIPAERQRPISNTDDTIGTWGDLKYLAFYVRRRNHIYERERTATVAPATATVEEEERQCCPVCFEGENNLTSRYNCIHHICVQCFDIWSSIRTRTRTTNSCPVCRSEI